MTNTIRTMAEWDRIIAAAQSSDPEARRLVASLEVTERQLAALFDQVRSLQDSAARIEERLLVVGARLERGAPAGRPQTYPVTRADGTVVRVTVPEPDPRD